MKRCPIYAVVFLQAALGASWAQSPSPDVPVNVPVEGSIQFNSMAGSVFGADNPPISGLDEAAMGPSAEMRSFLLPALRFSESLDQATNANPDNSGFRTITRALGSLQLQKLWKRYSTDLDYVGGVAFYSNRERTTSVLQQLGVVQRIEWQRWQLAIRDSFSYLPEGPFGHGSFGGEGGGGGGFGGEHFGSVGQEPRIANVAGADLTHLLTPRSAVTVAGAYTMVNFTDNPPDLINSREVSAQAAYSYQLNRTNQIGLMYGYQYFQYPQEETGTFSTQLIHVVYSHRISGRMDLVAAGGPQFVFLQNPIFGPTQRFLVSGRVALKYNFSRMNVALAYHRYVTSGSGFFPGADTNGVRFSATRQMSRLWELVADVGYSHNSRLQPGFDGSTAQTFQFGYVGAAARRQVRRDLVAFVRYQYTNSDNVSCGGPGGSCEGVAYRNTATFGLDWTFKPIRLD